MQVANTFESTKSDEEPDVPEVERHALCIESSQQHCCQVQLHSPKSKIYVVRS
jgi:hypothetical protein